jgi:hypothetical protein
LCCRLFRRWVSIGALVTIALLAVDPFLQSVIDYPGKIVPTDLHTATVGVATSLDIGGWYSNPPGWHHDPETRRTSGTCVIPYEDRAMSATTVLGFIDGSALRLSQPPLLGCATGNCTWTYSTLAVCSRCEDLTSLITTETLEKTPKEMEALYACASQSYAAPATTNNFVRYRLTEKYNLSLCAPGGILGAPSSSIGSPGESGFGRTQKVRLAAGLVVSPEETHHFNTSDTLLASVAVLHVSDDYWARKTPFNASSARATECSLTLCTQLYEAEMKLGELTERLLSSTSRRGPDSFIEIKTPFPPAYNLTWTDEDPGISLSRRGPFLPNCGFSEDLQLLIHRTDLQLHMSHEDGANINVQTTFNITHKAIDTVIYDLATNLAPRLVDLLSPSGNITQTFERAARLMSYHMREAAGRGSAATTAAGETRQWVTYIRVRWGYMLLPIVLAVAIAVFAAGVTAQSHRLGLNDVKGDTVSAMLLVDGHTRHVLRVEPGGGRRDEVVRGLRLQLGRDEKGVYLEEGTGLLPMSNNNRKP